MKIKLYRHLCISVCMLFSLIAKSQSIGYSFSYTLPYHRDYNTFSFNLINKYAKSTELSIGISLNNYIHHFDAVQIRLSRYTSTLNEEVHTIVGIAYSESNVTKYVVELEEYFLSKKFLNKLAVSIGTKFSYLIRSSHDSFTSSFGRKIISTQIGFGGSNKLKLDLLFKLNFNKINITNNLSLVPSYVFGYGFSNDFKAKYPKSLSLNHRFELSLIKNLNQKKGEPFAQ